MTDVYTTLTRITKLRAAIAHGEAVLAAQAADKPIRVNAYARLDNGSQDETLDAALTAEVRRCFDRLFADTLASLRARERAASHQLVLDAIDAAKLTE